MEDCLKGVGKMAAKRRVVSINVRESSRGGGAGGSKAKDKKLGRGGGCSSKYVEYNTLSTDSIIVLTCIAHYFILEFCLALSSTHREK